jgi:hypothetical protein
MEAQAHLYYNPNPNIIANDESKRQIKETKQTAANKLYFLSFSVLLHLAIFFVTKTDLQ